MSETLEAVRPQYLTAAILGDRAAAANLTAELLAGGLEPEAIILDLLLPAQQEIGRRWQAGECSLAQEHTATGVTESLLASLTVGLEPAPTRGHLVVSCAEGEYHALPARIASELLMLQGWRVTFLGAAVPAQHLRIYLADVEADAVAVSCTVGYNLTGTARSVAAARDTGHTVVVGGAAFGSDGARARALGAHGWIASLSPAHPLDLAEVLFDEVADPPTAGEWSALERTRRFIVAEAIDWLEDNFPSSVDPTNAGLERVRSDLDAAIRFVAASLVVGDPSVVSEYREWQSAVLVARGEPPVTVGLYFEALAAATEGHAPDAYQALRAASGV